MPRNWPSLWVLRIPSVGLPAPCSHQNNGSMHKSSHAQIVWGAAGYKNPSASLPVSVAFSEFILVIGPFSPILPKCRDTADLPLREEALVSPHKKAGMNKSFSFGSTPLISPLDLRAEEGKMRKRNWNYSVDATCLYIWVRQMGISWVSHIG